MSDGDANRYHTSTMAETTTSRGKMSNHSKRNKSKTEVKKPN